MADILSVWGPMLFGALGQTLLLALLGLFFGCILGIIFGLLSVVKSKVCRAISLVYVNVIQGIPMLVLAFFMHIGVVSLLNNTFHAGITVTSLESGTIVLALNCGAYMSEIIRAGIQSIDPGQMEAARSLGLTYWRGMFRVVLPQAIKNMVPSIVNQFIITLKDTSILSCIGYPELVNKAKNVIGQGTDSFLVWAIVALMYLIVILILRGIAKLLERRLNRGRKAR